MKNKKIDFLVNQFKLTENEAKKIANTCKTIRADKYLVWVAKEYKKNPDLLSDIQNLIYIFDWVKKENIDVLKYDFDGLMKGSQKWHKENFKQIERENNWNSMMHDGIVYKCKDGKHFFKLLSLDELEDEGKLMGNCIGTSPDYKNRLKNDLSIFISLRDEKNLPHVDIEIDSLTSQSLQVYGKGNEQPSVKYKALILEYAFYALGVKDRVDQEIIDIITKTK